MPCTLFAETSNIENKSIKICVKNRIDIVKDVAKAKSRKVEYAFRAINVKWYSKSENLSTTNVKK